MLNSTPGPHGSASEVAEADPLPGRMLLSLLWVPPPKLSIDLSSFCPIQVPLDNHIPVKARPERWDPTEPQEIEENEVIPKRIAPFEGDEDVSNKVSMSSAAQSSSIFERTEVLAGKGLTRYFEEGRTARQC